MTNSSDDLEERTSAMRKNDDDHEVSEKETDLSCKSRKEVEDRLLAAVPELTKAVALPVEPALIDREVR